ncbi:hypothetical protein IRJ41_000869 [Triplophysa rosa]|uniref:Uncharacterized protein n=1 Tax=Triplophysa rosa TaxID=992332 RepID=A0A9W7T6K7_TRIRA|nr:hypothetical protein IRJ41_000869 [Triplophysa rosa]
MATTGDFDPLNATIPATKVEITVSCRPTKPHELIRLLKMDGFVQKLTRMKETVAGPLYCDCSLIKSLFSGNSDSCASDELIPSLLSTRMIAMRLCRNLLDMDTFSKSDPSKTIFYTSNKCAKLNLNGFAFLIMFFAEWPHSYPKSIVQVRNLLDMDTFSKSDPSKTIFYTSNKCAKLNLNGFAFLIMFFAEWPHVRLYVQLPLALLRGDFLHSLKAYTIK